MKTLKEALRVTEALFSRKNIGITTYTIDEVIKEKLQIFVVKKNLTIIFLDCYNESYNQLTRDNRFIYSQREGNRGLTEDLLNACVREKDIVYYNMIDYKNDISDIWKALEYFEDESTTYTDEDILNRVREEAGAELVEINIIK